MARRRVAVVSAPAVGTFESNPMPMLQIADPLVRAFALNRPSGTVSVAAALYTSDDYNPENRTGHWTVLGRCTAALDGNTARTRALTPGVAATYCKLVLEVAALAKGVTAQAELWADATTFETARKVPAKNRHNAAMLDDTRDLTQPEIRTAVARDG